MPVAVLVTVPTAVNLSPPIVIVPAFVTEPLMSSVPPLTVMDAPASLMASTSVALALVAVMVPPFRFATPSSREIELVEVMLP